VNAAAHIVVSGLVQGVGFRYFVQHSAQRLRLQGWVRNLPNADVEIEVEGEKESIEQLISSVRQGPRSAVVSDVEVTWEEFRGKFQRFEITY
jgi:acylphosphatase